MVVTGDPKKVDNPEAIAAALSIQNGVQIRVRIVMHGLSIEGAVKIEQAIPRLSAMRQLTEADITALLMAPAN